MPPLPPRMKVPLRSIDNAGNSIEGVDLTLQNMRNGSRIPRIWQAQSPDPVLATPPYKSNPDGEFNLWLERNDLKALFSHALLSADDWFPVPLMHFDVRDFGAKGDGVTDDRTAIQECVDAAKGNGITWFSPGEYMIGGDASVQLYRDCHLEGCGDLSVVKRLDNIDDTLNDRPLFDSANEPNLENVMLRNFCLDDNIAMNLGQGNFGGWMLRLKPQGTNRGHHIVLDGMTHRSAFWSHFGCGIFQCDNVVVRDCNFYNCRRDGISVMGDNGVVVIGNRVYSDGLGNLADPLDDGDDMISTWGSDRLIILGNLFYSETHERGRGILLAGNTASVVADNHAFGGWRACVGLESFTGGAVASIAWNAPTSKARITTVAAAHGLTNGQSVVIDGPNVRGYQGTYVVTTTGLPANQFDLNGSLNLGPAAGGTYTIAGQAVEGIEDSIIANNTLDSGGYYHDTGGWGDAVSVRAGGLAWIKDVQFIGNVAKDPKRHGVWMDINNDYCEGIRVLDTMVTVDRAAAHIAAAADVGCAVRIEGYGKIADLEVRGTRSKWTNGEGIYISCLVDVLDVEDNRIANCGTSGGGQEKFGIRIEPQVAGAFMGDAAIVHNRVWDTRGSKGTDGLRYTGIDGALRVESNDVRQTRTPVSAQESPPSGGLIIDKNFGWNPWQGSATVSGMTGTPRTGSTTIPFSPDVPSGSKLLVTCRTAGVALIVTGLTSADATVQAVAIIGTPASCVLDWVLVPPS